MVDNVDEAAKALNLGPNLTRDLWAYWLGKPVAEVTSVPGPGAVGQAVEALVTVGKLLSAIRVQQVGGAKFIEINEIEHLWHSADKGRRDALRALGGETKGDGE